MSDLRKQKIQERITSLNTLGLIPSDEVQLNVDVVYNSILDKVCSIVNLDSPRQVISALTLRYGNKEKAIDKNNKDVQNTYLTNEAMTMPLDDNGYITDKVTFTTNSNEFIGNYKNIIPGTIKISNTNNTILYADDSNGNLVNATTLANVGSVDYFKSVFSITDTITNDLIVNYRFDIYNIETSRNTVYFEKTSREVFADLYQLDLDIATIVDDAKMLKSDVKDIIPKVLSQQIDKNILNRFFEQLELDSTHNVTWDANADTSTNISRKFRNFGAYLSIEMNKFTSRTGIIPNVIICDPTAYSVIKNAYGFISKHPDDFESINTPSVVGVFGTAIVVLTQPKLDSNRGQIVITYKGPNESSASAGIYTPFIPVTLREVFGSEGNGMIKTNTAYAISGFSIINPSLISGVSIINIDTLDA